MSAANTPEPTLNNVDTSTIGGGDTRQPSADAVADFKMAFRLHPAGIAIIAANTDAGPVGLTASSVASVGINPLALVFSVTRATGSAGALLSADTLTVNLLTDVDVQTAKAFAQSGAPRFTAEQGWARLDTGEPFLPTAQAVFRCRAMQTVPVGGSSLVIAEVLDVHLGQGGTPLVYHDRRFHALDVNAAEL